MQLFRRLNKPRKGRRPTVLIIEPWVKHYRVPFFSQLQSVLAGLGIDLLVAYSDPNSIHELRRDSAELPVEWSRKVKAYWLANRLSYQPLWHEIAGADLIVVRSEIKHLLTYPLLVMSALGMKTVAYWGLGPNMHPDRTPAAEWLKERLCTNVDWWFAYTPSIVEYLKTRGVPAERITNVQNATDTTELRRLINDIPDDEVLAAKVKLTGAHDTVIGLYCGLMGDIKALPLLLEAATLVKQKNPLFHLVLIGNGPDRPWLERRIAHEPWVHYLGSQYGRDSALYYKMADAFLLAGTAGLSIVDSFAAGLPLLMTKLPTHPPEVSYVIDNVNGRMVSQDAEAFAESISEVLRSPDLMSRLRKGAGEAGSQYTMEAMVRNFSTGIKKCLDCHLKVPPRTVPEAAIAKERYGG